MHGYDSYHNDMKGFAIVTGKNIVPGHIAEVSLLDICPTLCAALGIPDTRCNEGTSLLQRQA